MTFPAFFGDHAAAPLNELSTAHRIVRCGFEMMKSEFADR
jgi:hypothetical protein